MSLTKSRKLGGRRAGADKMFEAIERGDAKITTTIYVSQKFYGVMNQINKLILKEGYPFSDYVIEGLIRILEDKKSGKRSTHEIEKLVDKYV